MKKIFGLAIAALMVMGLIGGGTWAYFSDVETSAGNTFTAGTLNLTTDIAGTYIQPNNVNGVMAPTNGGDGINDSVTFNKIAPGDSGTITWTLANVGNLKGYLALVASVTGNTNGTNEPEDVAITSNAATDLNLADLMGVKLTRTIGGVGEEYRLGTPDNYVPLSGLAAILDTEVDKAIDEDTGTNDTYVYKLYWSIASDVKKAGVDGKFGEVPGTPPTNDDVVVDDNILQTDTATINISFYLDQVSGVSH